ncbi:acyl-CoA carboxylase subunit epsilon [Streptomyces hypolithicus]
MGGSQDIRAVLRVERGHPSDEEVTVLALTLMSLLAARAARQRTQERAQRSVARRHGWDLARGYQAPHSWR